MTAKTSFVAEILATTGKRDKDDISAALEKLSLRIDQVKAEWYEALQKKYVDFFPSLDSAVELHARADALSEEIHDLTCKIEREVKDQLNTSASEFEELAVHLRESKLIMDILDKMMSVEEKLAGTGIACSNKDFVEAVKCQSAVDQSFQQPVFKRENEIHALVILREEFRLQQSNLQKSLHIIWGDAVKWVIPQEKNQQPSKNKDCTKTLHLKKANDVKDFLGNAVQAMVMLDLLDDKLAVFGQHMFEHLLKPLVSYCDTAITWTNENGHASLAIKYSLNDSKTNQTPSPSSVFKKIQIVCHFLNDHLMNISVGNEESSTDDGSTLMQRFGRLTSERYLKFLTEEFLTHSIPTSSQDFEKYHIVINAITLFEEELSAVKYLPEDNHILADFSGNAYRLFANKNTQEILVKARALMMSDLHNTVKVDSSKLGSMKPLGLEGSTSKKKKTDENLAISSGSRLSPNTFRFPECLVSEYVESLMSLVYATLREVVGGSPASAVQTFYATRDVFELFCSVVPTYHKHSLSTLPQLAALHHNNCMYIAHELLTLGALVAPHLPPSLAPTYMDLVPRLRLQGTRCFMAMMSQQKSLLLESLSMAQGFQNLGEAENQARAEQGVKQTLHQLRHLVAVWRDVLPSNVFCKSIGTLVNAVVVEVVDAIVALVDIAEDDSREIHALLSLLTAQAPALFTDTPDAVAASCEAVALKRVSKWGKLKELLLLQTASMQEIVDRWAEGKGPLACYFTANEVKQVIRAVFQNTDRRANVLSKIR